MNSTYGTLSSRSAPKRAPTRTRRRRQRALPVRMGETCGLAGFSRLLRLARGRRQLGARFKLRVPNSDRYRPLGGGRQRETPDSEPPCRESSELTVRRFSAGRPRASGLDPRGRPRDRLRARRWGGLRQSIPHATRARPLWAAESVAHDKWARAVDLLGPKRS